MSVAEDELGDAIGGLAFYGRCSTEDNQDPRTSREWQLGNAQKFVGPLGGRVVEEFFDIGQSRSVSWDRRRQASELLAALKNPNRGWSALVVGEGTRCWFGNQFSLVAPRFEAYGVDIWVPELGGKYDSRNASHKMLMSVLGGMSESERQHVQARVRAAMDAQVVNEGRHQGGRAPYGYMTVNGGPHPNPRKAAEGFHLRVLSVDEPAAAVVRRIFAEYVSGNGDRAIANILNREGIACPSAHRPEQNRHRLADGWQGSAVKAILENPRYTGYAVFGRWTKHEVLIDPDDVAAGHKVLFKRSAPERVVRSREPAHPPIVTVEEFTEVALMRATRAAGGLTARSRLERGTKRTKHVYALRGRVRCAYCKRRMEGTPRQHRIYYRCAARTIVPGSPLLATHPANVYLPEITILDGLNDWIGRLFSRPERDNTLRHLLGVSADPGESARGEAIKARKAAAQERVKNLLNLAERGVEMDALVDRINSAQQEINAASEELAHTPAGRRIEREEIEARMDMLTEQAQGLRNADPADLRNLYEALDLEALYTAEERTVEVTVRPFGRDNAGVRGGT
ncbi:recombinase family protein [Actinokineospora pegani]|uniref:recombinase family protein n=1 Tax=Actinokineospora pegani TaxID=2654637 RepID=UPI001F3D1A08|nr:recombinase family protein [Actinokineospora pegani]